MSHLPALISDLATILITAAAVTLLFKYLKQPSVLGYLVAGILVGPHFSLFPTIADISSIKIWAEIGVIFLLFGLGLEFSYKKLFSIGQSALITGLFGVFALFGLGYLSGQALGWHKMDSIFLGGIISISSTTIIIKAIDELGLKGRPFVNLVFGILIVEDIAAILLLVLLSTIAATQTLNGLELFLTSFNFIFFLTLWFVLGIFLVPILLKKISPYLSDETTLVVSLGLCLLMVVLATQAGFSPALGAFIMGSIISETSHSERIEHLMKPVKDLFGAIFFVSVGMLLNPEILYSDWSTVLFISLVVIIGKIAANLIGGLLAGYPIKRALYAGLALTQIGEFSFIIATLGVTLKVTSDRLYSICIAVSAVTTFTTPYLIKSSSTVYKKFDQILPVVFKDRLARYENALKRTGSRSLASLVVKAYFGKIILNSVVIVAINLGLKKIALPKIVEVFNSTQLGIALTLALAFILSAPFFWGLLLGQPNIKDETKKSEYKKLRFLQFGIVVLRVVLALSLFVFLLNQFINIPAISAALMILFLGVFFLFTRFAEPLYHRLESRFMSNISEKDDIENKRRPLLAPWNASLSEFTLSADSDLVGKTLIDSALKEKFGVTIALIERGSKKILAPGGFDLLLPHDRIYLVGNEEQLQGAQKLIEASPNTIEESHVGYGLEPHSLESNSKYISCNIRDCGLREDINGLIVGIERAGQRILNPDPAVILQEGDLLWLVGNLKKIRALKS